MRDHKSEPAINQIGKRDREKGTAKLKSTSNVKPDWSCTTGTCTDTKGEDYNTLSIKQTVSFKHWKT